MGLTRNCPCAVMPSDLIPAELSSASMSMSSSSPKATMPSRAGFEPKLGVAPSSGVSTGTGSPGDIPAACWSCRIHSICW